MPAVLTRQGVTPADIEAARAEVNRLNQEHEDALQRAQARMTEMREANDGALPATAEVRDEVRELYATADQLGAELDQARDYLADLQGRAYGRDPQDRMPAARAARDGHSPAAVLSLAGRILESDAFRSAGAARELVGRRLDIELASRDELRALLAPVRASAGLLDVVGDDMTRLFPPTALPSEAPRFLDLISVTATDRDVVVYGVETEIGGTGVTGAAPGTAFGSTTITTERREATVKRRGTLMDVFEDVLNDEPRMLSWLEPRLRRRVRLDAEAQALFGDGEGQNYTGLTEWEDVGTRQRANGQSIADAIHAAITDVRIAYYGEPDALGFRPEVWHELLTERSEGDGHYVNSGGPFGPMPTSVWGKQIWTSTLLRDGSDTDPLDCIVGYHPEAELVVREGISLREFEQNKDNIEKGIITLRAQHRSVFIVNQPLAFVLLDLVEAAAPGGGGEGGGGEGGGA